MVRHAQSHSKQGVGYISRVIPNIKSTVCQDWIEPWCWFYISVGICRNSKLIQSFQVVLTVWLLSSGPKILSSIQTAWSFDVKYLQNDFILSLQFLYFVQQFSITKTYWIRFGLLVFLEVKRVLKSSETLEYTSFAKKLGILW